jgi:tetratricopeptide (TPR) repeat protein
MRRRQALALAPKRLLLLVAGLAVVASVPTVAGGEDVVVLRGKTPQARLQRRGEIVDWIGGQLRLKGPLDREEPLSADRIVEVQTSWPDAKLAGDRQLTAGQTREAIASYREAKRQERRAWAAREISAALTIALLEAGDADAAGSEFLSIAAADPATHRFDAIPLAWRAAAEAGPLAQAAAWLASDSPAAKLLGASWLLPTERRADAVAALQSLRTSADRRIAAAAEIQLWRTRLLTAQGDEVQRWQAAADKVGPELRGVAWYLVGEALAGQGKSEEAALAYLQTALVYGRQRALAADALAAAGAQLEKLGRKEQAAGLYRELLRDFPASAAAVSAQARIDALSRENAPSASR